MPKETKPLFERDIECQYCSKLNHVKVTKKVVVAPEPGQYTLDVVVTKAGKQEHIVTR